MYIFIHSAVLLSASWRICLELNPKAQLLKKVLSLFEFIVLGVSSERDTPVSIPNTEVKPLSSDGSRKVRVGRCQGQ